MSKKALEARIVALEAEVRALRAQLSRKQGVGVPVTPSYPYLPNDWYPWGYPKIWCGSDTVSNKGQTPTVAFN